MKLTLFVVMMSTPAFAAPAAGRASAKPAPVAKPTDAAPKAASVDAVGAMKRALASTGGQKSPGDPAKIDPNAALEVRGQSRTLSMMLVLKNGKEAINFIKVRKDYRPEITSTPY